MAEYLGSMKLGTAYDGWKPDLSGYGSQSMVVEGGGVSENLVSPDVARSAAYGAQGGGASGALISGGLTSTLGAGGLAGGGPYALAGGLILSQIEAAQKAKAAAEQERIANEKARRVSSISQYNKNASMTFDI